MKAGELLDRDETVLTACRDLGESGIALRSCVDDAYDGQAGFNLFQCRLGANMTTPCARICESGGIGRAAAEAQVYVVDDDRSVCKAVARLLAAEGYSVSWFESAAAFLACHDPDAHGCILLDISMPGLDGIALQQTLVERGNYMPIIFLTGHADVPMCVRAMKDGAFDFLTKPAGEEVLLGAVVRALEKSETLRRLHAQRVATEARLATLTPREREVLHHVIAGRLNKQIAADLGTSEKTIKVHRARGIKKMCVRSVAELVRIVDRARPRGMEDGGSS